MLTLTGEVRKIIPNEYTNKNTGEVGHRAIIIIEPDNVKHNYELQLTTQQCDSGAIKEWQKAKGKIVSVPASLYVNYEYKFHKFTAINEGLPQIST